MKKIIAVNASPRKEWNTGTMIREAAKGAESAGAEVKVYDLYKLEKFTGCIYANYSAGDFRKGRQCSIGIPENRTSETEKRR